MRLVGSVTMAAMLLAAVLAASSPAAAGEEVRWLTLDAALARQKVEAKPVVIFFHLVYCWRCKEMKRKVYADPRVIGQLNRRFIPAQVDLAQRQDLGERWGVDYIPTHVFLAPGGKEVLRRKGIISLSDYLLMLAYVAGGHYRQMDFADFAKERR